MGGKFDLTYVRQLRRKRAAISIVWYLDEVVFMIQGRRYYLRQPVDQDVYILDKIRQKRRNTKTAKRLRPALYRSKELITTDKPVLMAPQKRKVSRLLSTVVTKAQQSRAELAFAFAKTRVRHAEVQVAGPPSPVCAISSFPLTSNALQSTFTFIASTLSLNGNKLQCLTLKIHLKKIIATRIQVKLTAPSANFTVLLLSAIGLLSHTDLPDRVYA